VNSKLPTRGLDATRRSGVPALAGEDAHEPGNDQPEQLRLACIARQRSTNAHNRREQRVPDLTTLQSREMRPIDAGDPRKIRSAHALAFAQAHDGATHCHRIAHDPTLNRSGARMQTQAINRIQALRIRALDVSSRKVSPADLQRSRHTAQRHQAQARNPPVLEVDHPTTRHDGSRGQQLLAYPARSAHTPNQHAQRSRITQSPQLISRVTPTRHSRAPCARDAERRARRRSSEPVATRYRHHQGLLSNQKRHPRPLRQGSPAHRSATPATRRAERR
jgi:hypothetical protein